MSNIPTNLPFSKKFQAGLIAQLILDYDFLRNIIDDITPGHLDGSNAHIKLLKIVKGIYNIVKKPLTVDIIRNAFCKLEQQNIYTEPEIAGIKEVLDLGLTLTPVEASIVKTDAYDFLRKQTVARAVSDSITFLESNKIDDVYQTITDAYKKTFGIGETVGYKYNEESVLARYLEPPRSNIWSSGFPKLDDYLDGGFAQSECYTVLSASGRGKTSLLTNFSVTSLRQNKNCLFLTGEMSDKQICQRQDSIICGLSATEIAMNKEFQFILDSEIKMLKGQSVVKGFARGGLAMSGVRTFLDRFCNEVWKPDVLILDWLGCLKLGSSRDSKKHELLAEAADDFVNLTREYSLTGITAHQTNRSAVSQDIFDYSAISESFASLFGMDIVMGLGASNTAKDAGKRTLSLLKNRFGPDSVYVKLVGDLPGQPLTFRFKEAPQEDEESDLLGEDS